MGSWHEATITKILRATEEDNSKLTAPAVASGGPDTKPFPLRNTRDEYVYLITYDGLVQP